MRGKRLYYYDAYVTDFTASVVQITKVNGSPALVLDRSYFYPESGGQPHDLGSLNGIPVVEVQIRSDDLEVIHVLSEDLSAEVVTGAIDWQRRFDHMQQHTGQHILSRALSKLIKAETVSFHLGKAESTIDVAAPEIDYEDILAVEELANQIIWENRPVRIQFVNQEEMDEQEIRKLPELQEGPIRIVEIDNFDKTACGGTHVKHTGEIGQIKVIKQQALRGGTRLTFVCGARALKDYQYKDQLTAELAGEFTTGVEEIKESVNKLRAENRDTRQELKKIRGRYVSLEAEIYMNSAERAGSLMIISELFTDRDIEELRMLANYLCRNEAVVVLFATAEPKLQLIFCRSNDASPDMSNILTWVMEKIESIRGGGSEKFAQAVGPAVQTDRANQLLNEAKEYLVETSYERNR